MATISRRSSGIPQPVSSRGPSRQGAKQTYYRQRLSSEQPNKRDDPTATPDLSKSPHNFVSSSHQQVATQSTPADSAERQSDSSSPPEVAPHSPGGVSTQSQMSSLSASLSMNSSLGPGKVRAMFQARRQGGSAQNSPVGWDKSYPLDPIGKGTPPAGRQKDTPPGGRQKRTPPAKSGAGRRADRSPPQQRVSRGRQQGAGGAPPRRAKSHGSVETGQSRRVAKPAARSSSAGRSKRKPPRRQEDRNRLNDVMRHRESELLDKIKGSTQEPAGLKPRAQRRSKSKSPAPPKGAAKSSKKALSPTPNKRNGGSRRGSTDPGSRRQSINPYKEPKAPEMPRPPPTDPNMAQCPICTRSFAKDRLEKHQQICEKSHAKKRKVFDPVKMRVQGTESEQYIKKIKQGGDKNAKSPKKPDWRRQHEEFVSNIRAAKKAQAHLDAGGSLADLPPPPPSENPDYVQCPHCERRFNEAAAERHIPKCSSISSNKGPAAGGRGGRKRR